MFLPSGTCKQVEDLARMVFLQNLSYHITMKRDYLSFTAVSGTSLLKGNLDPSLG